MLKKVLVLAAIAFVVYYVLHNPEVAGHTLHVGGKNAWHGVRSVAASLAKFINTLVS
jgi:preprotein translocase subunit SecG